jgi:CBS domain-containing protein
MQLAKVARRQPLCIDREATIEEASRVMRDQCVDALVVTETSAGTPLAAGILSAHDIVTRVIAVGLEPSVVTAGDILWHHAAALPPS